MKHGSKKAKFGGGMDANKMLMRKLAINFFTHGKIVTTEKKAKALKAYVEVLTHKSKESNEANKNYLISRLTNMDIVKKLFDEVGPAVKNANGGYVKIQRLQQRFNDGALMAKMEWAYPVVTSTAPAEEPKKAEKVEEVQSTTEEKPKRRTRKAAAK